MLRYALSVLLSHWSNILKQYCTAICLSSRFLGPIGVSSLLKLVGVAIAGDRPRSGVVGVAIGDRPAWLLIGRLTGVFDLLIWLLTG